MVNKKKTSVCSFNGASFEVSKHFNLMLFTLNSDPTFLLRQKSRQHFSNLLSSNFASLVVACMLQDFIRCMLRESPLHILVITNDSLSYCCLPVSSKHPTNLLLPLDLTRPFHQTN